MNHPYIPTLTGKAADDFVKRADEAFKNRSSIDFSKEFKAMKQILNKSGDKNDRL